MQELINKLTTEVGLTAEQATKTISTLMEHLKTKLPASLSGNLDAMFSGAKGEEKVESIQDKAEDLAEAAKDKLEDLAEVAKDKLSDAADKAEELAKDAFGKLKGMFGGDKE